MLQVTALILANKTNYFGRYKIIGPLKQQLVSSSMKKMRLLLLPYVCLKHIGYDIVSPLQLRQRDWVHTVALYFPVATYQAQL